MTKELFLCPIFTILNPVITFLKEGRLYTFVFQFTSMNKEIKAVHGHSRIDGVVPGVRGQRAFPNQKLRTFDPFVMLDHIGAQNMGAEYFVDGRHSAHPHRGFETITFLFEGIMKHKDSKGNRIDLYTGDVQRMNAGNGIIHGGDFASDPKTGFFHEVQLWVNVPAKYKMSEPRIQNVLAQEIPEIALKNGKIRVISGNIGTTKGPINTIQPTQIAHIQSSAKQKVRICDIENGYQSMVYVLKGEIEIGEQIISPYHSVILSDKGEKVSFCTNGSAEVLFIAGKPINELVVMGGPFVMNTQEEIDQAYSDYSAGKFGEIK